MKTFIDLYRFPQYFVKSVKIALIKKVVALIKNLGMLVSIYLFLNFESFQSTLDDIFNIPYWV